MHNLLIVVGDEDHEFIVLAKSGWFSILQVVAWFILQTKKVAKVDSLAPFLVLLGGAYVIHDWITHGQQTWLVAAMKRTVVRLSHKLPNTCWKWGCELFLNTDCILNGNIDFKFM